MINSKLVPVDEVKLLIDELIVCALTCELEVGAAFRTDETLRRCAELRQHCAEICFQLAQRLITDSMASRSSLSLCVAFCTQYVETCQTINLDDPSVQACTDCAEVCERYLSRSKA